ncbi:type II toxin-antitoxin system death-on-curing family toxin [Calidithermus timidus]|jgi:death-on-curing family protein|uniref:type II toxin-antitoxin system death-on-curing family toxin n=1 Tax=Calidithermus timidus TaxID=307124 RepID=UPI0009FFB0DB|nr:type II toxin-antitoxin system death-on-curing family toxin [Calidithermus timidus]
MALRTLSIEEVKLIHEALVKDFCESKDPISPPGVRSEELLSSAVDRQYVGTGDSLKYFDEYTSAATLAYGICMNHCFHNGNKRTAVVSMLSHLDKNGLRLKDVQENDLYELFVKFAGHQIHKVPSVYRYAVSDTAILQKYRKTLDLPNKVKQTLDTSEQLSSRPDLEVYCLAVWLRRHTRIVKNFDREITLRELRRILSRYGITVERGNDVSHHIYKKATVRKREGWLSWRSIEVSEAQRVYTLAIGGENRPISINQIKDIRKACGLDPDNGVDAASFYGEEPAIDYFLAHYSRLLRRLAKT